MELSRHEAGGSAVREMSAVLDVMQVRGAAPSRTALAPMLRRASDVARASGAVMVT